MTSKPLSTRRRFEGRLTARDAKRCVTHHVDVPRGASDLTLSLRFSPPRLQGLSNLLTLTLFDPHGFRGAGHRGGAEHRVRITPTEATSGYLPGPLPPGEWTVEIDAHRVMPGEPLRYTLEVRVVRAPTPGSESSEVPVRRRADPLRGGPAWFRGDLHTHTNHSDAEAAQGVTALVGLAREQGLDFLFVTDHNTTAGLLEVDAAACNDLLLAGGIELTTYWGHALVLGTRDWIDWRVRPGTGAMARIAEAAAARGEAFIIAHPQSLGDPVCTGCAWRFGDVMPGPARLVEVWNGPWPCSSNNAANLALWYDWLNQGVRIFATAGSDIHAPSDYEHRPGFTRVYAEALSEPALIRAIRAGRMVLSSGPTLVLEAEGPDGQHWMVGDTVTVLATYRVAWAEAPAEARLRVLVDGRPLHQAEIASEGTYAWPMDPVDGNWVVAELWSWDGDLLAVTNPTFLGEDGT